MKLPKYFDLSVAVELLNGESDETGLESAFEWEDTPQGETFWQNELNAMRGYCYNHHGDEVDVPQRDLSDTALDYIRSLVAESLGIRAPSTTGGLQPAGNAIAAVVENVEAKLGKTGNAERAALPARALRFGQPQIMGGTGQWDNLRYMPNDEDEAANT